MWFVVYLYCLVAEDCEAIATLKKPNRVLEDLLLPAFTKLLLRFFNLQTHLSSKEKESKTILFISFIPESCKKQLTIEILFGYFSLNISTIIVYKEKKILIAQCIVQFERNVLRSNAFLFKIKHMPLGQSCAMVLRACKPSLVWIYWCQVGLLCMCNSLYKNDLRIREWRGKEKTTLWIWNNVLWRWGSGREGDHKIYLERKRFTKSSCSSHLFIGIYSKDANPLPLRILKAKVFSQNLDQT